MADRRFLITGAFGVLGGAVARAAAEEGERLVLVDAAPAAPQGLPAGLVLAGVDLSDPAQAQRAVDEAARRLGGLDALINVAGTFRWETVEGGSTETWDFLYRVNVTTAVNMSRAALPHLLKSPAGRIVNVGAGGALKAAAGMGAYAASKSGVHRLTEALAEETKGKGVTVNAVLPSILDTAQNRADMPDADFGKWVRPADLAAIILFLASEQAGAVTGALVPVTGGV
ncbi:MAG TPA: SDR family NAD(P)-dependent oxidoreductase [Caulobacteraceae bacterium]|nr:SDR family NAD(P)-dependent oxidoreductase [Caulobacteraceae bacterium]